MPTTKQLFYCFINYFQKAFDSVWHIMVCYINCLTTLDLGSKFYHVHLRHAFKTKMCNKN